jgi:protein SCO1/2
LNWSIGDEFQVVTLSINPKEGPDLAKKKKQAYLSKYGRLGAERGWHFLTGAEDQIQKLAAQVGFGYFYDAQTKEYAHSAGIFILTPEGKISRVLHGIDYPNRDLKLALLEASSGKVGSVLDRVMMFCYRYDPLSKGYALAAMRLVQLVSALMILIVAVFLFVSFRHERKLRV